ncbi:MAG: hypothetical protein KL787_09915 [Taibaiella sp.]|nr:hypothetical protein [Taibaiella sp.]
MSEDLRYIRKQLAEIKLLLQSREEPVNEKEAAIYLGVSQKTIQNKVYTGELTGTYVINRIGHRMYYKSKLLRRQ